VNIRSSHKDASIVKRTIVALTLCISPMALSAQDISRTSPPDDGYLILDVSGSVYSSTAIEIFWPSNSNPNVKYEVYRNGEQVKQFSNGLSHFDGELKPNTGYTYCVYAFAEKEFVSAGQISKFTADDGSGSEQLPINGTCPSFPPQPVTPQLSAEVYSSTAAEIFWRRNENAKTTYNLFRDGLLLTKNATGTSYFESGLNANTKYTYCLYDILDNVVIDRAAVTVATQDNGSGSEPMPAAGTCPSDPLAGEVPPIQPVEIGRINLEGVVYSETALEIFWNRVPSADVLYNVFRNGELVLTNSRASSFYDADLVPGTAYTYGVSAGSDGNTSSSAAITLSTPIQ